MITVKIRMTRGIMNYAYLIIGMSLVTMLVLLILWAGREPKAAAASRLPTQLPAATEGATASSSIRNFLKIDDRVCTAGQPTDAALQDLAKEGFRTILNLRTAQEGVDVVAEGQLVEKLGMRYIHIPVNPKAIQDSQVEEFLRVVSDSNNAPMLLHCASANRIGGFWLIYRVLKDGWSVEKAEEEAARVGLSSAELKRFALDYIVRNRQP